jgi:hypothetical protein
MQTRSRIGLDLGVVAVVIFCIAVWVAVILLVQMLV